MSLSTSQDQTFAVGVLSDPTVEQDELRSVVAAALRAECGIDRVRAAMTSDAHVDEALWQVLAGDIGVIGLVESADDAAGPACEEAVVVSELLGRALAPVPFVSAFVSAVVLTECGSSAHVARWLPVLAEGRERWAVVGGAVWPGQPADDEPSIAVSSAPVPGGGDDRVLLRGEQRHVLDGASCDRFLVVAGAPDDLAVYLVDAIAPQVRRTPLSVLDLTRGWAQVELSDAPALRISDVDPRAGLARAMQIGALLVAAESIGCAARCLETAVAHANTRYQFGRLIGSYQAVSHRCADALVELELARAVVAEATRVRAAGPSDELELTTSMAKLIAAETFEAIAGTAVQILGGLGVTWEHEAHLYLKRARSSRLIFGGPADHRRRVAEVAGL